MSNVTLQQKAEAIADVHVNYALGPNPGHEEAFCAREDYIAGYIAGAMNFDARLQFAKKQFNAIVELASQYREVYSLAVAKFSKEKLK